MVGPDYGSIFGEIKNPSQNPFRPKWDVFHKKLSASLLELCCYAHEIDLFAVGTWKPVPKNFLSNDPDLLIQSLENEGVFGVSAGGLSRTLDQYSDEQQQWKDYSLMVYAFKCCETLEIAESHTSDRGGSLNVIGEVEYCEFVSQLVLISDFIKWADGIGLKLPADFIGCNGDPELSGESLKGKFNNQANTLVRVLSELGKDPQDPDQIKGVKTKAFEICSSDHSKLFSLSRSTFDSIWIRAKKEGVIGKK